jgi:NAD(P)-dependent dehydrogenase (short-subunit alcohol dehydrogenase family)
MASKVMCITGGSSGIGASTARMAAAEGWNVVLTYASNESGARAVVLGIEGAGGTARMLRCDVGVEADVLSLFADLDAHEGIDCLVNNAGIAPGYGPFTSLSTADIERTVAVNVTGALLCAREAALRMSTAHGGRGGSIVNLSSKAAVLGGTGEWVHYAASKGAIDTLTVGLGRELANQGVRVNGVRPGLISGGFGPWDPHTRVESMRPNIPMQREGHPDEIAAAILWLASDAASYVTASTLDVTGGR